MKVVQILEKEGRLGMLAVTREEVAGYKKNEMIHIARVELSEPWPRGE